MMGKRQIKMCRALILSLFAVAMALGVLLSATIMPGIRGYAKESSSESVLVKKTLKQIDIKKKDSLYNKVKKVHDWMVFNIEYDHLWLDVDNGETAGYTKAQIEEAKTHQPAKVEWVLNNKLAICAGYSAVFKAMMDELGIECKVISSKSMNHAWNIKLKETFTFKDGGYWYYTYDDNGEMSHKSYFFPDGKEQKEF